MNKETKLSEAMKRIFSAEGLFSIVLLSAALWYFGYSFDLIPDKTPWIGYADDAVALLIGFSIGGWIYRLAKGQFNNKRR